MRIGKLFVLFSFVLCVNFSAFCAENPADSEVILSSATRRVEGNKLICTDTVVIQINRRKGETACEFALQYAKGDKLTIENAAIEDIFGNVIRKLKSNEILTRNYLNNVSTLYQDEFIKEFQLKHNVYPYRIKLCYKKIYDKFLLLDEWRPVEDIWQNHNFMEQPVRAAKLMVDIPAGYEVRYKSENIDEPFVENSKDRKIFTWETSYKGCKPEKNAPYSALKIPNVIVIPINFRYGVNGSWTSWDTFGDWVKRLNKNTLFLPPSEQQTVTRMLTGVTSVRQKIEILYKYLQTSTRYVDVKINTGGYRSYPAEYVATNKYGDCKALSTYMIALLKYAGIPAYYTLIRAGENIYTFDKDFPAQVFNHVIVTVPLEGDTLFLECTAKNIPCGYMGTSTQNREALVISDTPYFVHIPALTENDVKSSVISETNLEDDQNITNLKITARGYLYGLFSFITNNLSKTSVERYVRDILAVGRFQLENYEIENTNPSLPEICLSAKLFTYGIKQTYGNNVIVSPIPRALPDFEKPSERTMEVQLDYPICYSDTNIYIIPSHTNYREILQTEKFNCKFGNYSYDYKLENSKLTVIKNRTVFSGTVLLDEYPEFYDFIEKIKKIEKQSIQLISKD